MKPTQLGLLFLIVIFLSIILYSLYSYREGVENQITMTDITDAKKFVTTYNKTVEENACKKAINDLRTADSPDVNEIINKNLDISNCVVVDKISLLKNDANVTKLIHYCYGEKYEAVLNMITNLKSTKIYNSDEDFTELIDNIKEPKVSGNKSTPNEIDNFMNMMMKLQETK